MIREAKTADLEKVMPMFRDIFERTQYAGRTFDETHILRMWAVGCVSPNFYCRVVEHQGRIVGAMAGVIQANVWGMQIATDLFTFAERGTPGLIRNFVSWARERGAESISITNISGSARYDRLLERLGFTPEGTAFTRGL